MLNWLYQATATTNRVFELCDFFIWFVVADFEASCLAIELADWQITHNGTTLKHKMYKCLRTHSTCLKRKRNKNAKKKLFASSFIAAPRNNLRFFLLIKCLLIITHTRTCAFCFVKKKKKKKWHISVIQYTGYSVYFFFIFFISYTVFVCLIFSFI